MGRSSSLALPDVLEWLCWDGGGTHRLGQPCLSPPLLSSARLGGPRAGFRAVIRLPGSLGDLTCKFSQETLSLAGSPSGCVHVQNLFSLKS